MSSISSLASSKLAKALVLSSVTLLVVSCSSSNKRTAENSQVSYADQSLPGRAHRTSTFPIPPEIEPNVDFWRKVFGVWNSHQVVLHDDTYLGVVYEVVNVPSGVSYRSYTPTIDARKAYYQSQLREIQALGSNSRNLTPDQKRIVAMFKHSNGNIYGAADRVRAQRGIRETFKRGLEISGRYDKVFRENMRSRGVPEDLAILPHVESSFRGHARSSVGAAGMWQFMPDAGKRHMTLNSAVDERWDPVLASRGAANYLARAHQMLGNWPLAITSYNHGKGGMMRAKREVGSSDIGKIVANYKGPAFGFSSRNFYAEFMAARDVAINDKKFFPEGVAYEKPFDDHTVVTTSSSNIYNLASQYQTSVTSLVAANRHLRDSVAAGRTNIPAGTTIFIPKNGSSYTPAPETMSNTVLASNDTSSSYSPSTTASNNYGNNTYANTYRPKPANTETYRVPAISEPSYQSVSFNETRNQANNDSNNGLTFARMDDNDSVAAVNFDNAPRDDGYDDFDVSTPTPVRTPTPAIKTVAVAKVVAERKAAETTRASAPNNKNKPVVAKATAKPTSTKQTLARTTNQKSKDTKLAKASKASASSSRYYVVKPKETLYRVAVNNGLSVDQLKRLNKMSGNNNKVIVGQKLRVSE